jgi:predicted phosphate transport protein (TIGR00153 family)
MSLNSFFQFFTPKDKKFFPLFEQATLNLVAMTNLMVKLVNSKSVDERNSLVSQIDDLEHVGDKIKRSILAELSRNFITPFDREDIHDLAVVLDGICNYMNGSAKDFVLYDIREYSQAIRDLVHLIQQGVSQVQIAVKEMESMNNIHVVNEAIVRIHSIESKADDILDQSLSDLFKYEDNIKDLIKMKQILCTLENATDKCEDVADVISSIVLKNS